MTSSCSSSSSTSGVCSLTDLDSPTTVALKRTRLRLRRAWGHRVLADLSALSPLLHFKVLVTCRRPRPLLLRPAQTSLDHTPVVQLGHHVASPTHDNVSDHMRTCHKSPPPRVHLSWTAHTFSSLATAKWFSLAD
jgi:hypothetical protein